MNRIANIALPLLVAALLLGFWEWKVAHDAIPVYVLPAPSAIARALGENFSTLMESLGTTLLVTLLAFLSASIAALLLAIADPDEKQAEVLRRWSVQTVKNVRGLDVGTVRAVEGVWA